jgi:DNA-binding transcriptional MocR family regulator
MARATHLYQGLADSIQQWVREGTLRPGERVPSVRRLSRQRRISVATVLRAYSHLEAEGVIEARPQSGYYVRVRRLAPVPEPAVSEPAPKPVDVSNASLLSGLLESMRDPRMLPLGGALLGAGLLDLERLSRVCAATARRRPELAYRYATGLGDEALRAELAKRSHTWGGQLKRDELLLTLGGTEALHLALRAVTKPGDVVAVEAPTYFGILTLLQSLGLKALGLATHPSRGLDVDYLERALKRQKVAAVLSVATYSNPLGAVIPDAEKQRLVALLARRRIPLIEDDTFGDLAWDGGRPRAAKAWDKDGQVILVGSFSKTLAPGYRVGWVAGGKRQAALVELKATTTMAGPGLIQRALADYLRQGYYDRHLRRLNRRLRLQVQQVAEAVGAHFPQGTRLALPQGGFLLWVELPEGCDALKLHRAALAKGISLAPGPMFSARGRYRSFVRLNCGLDWSDKVEAGLASLGRMAKEQLKEGH